MKLGTRVSENGTNDNILGFVTTPRNMIVLGEFVNGNTIIHNVPYTKNLIIEHDRENSLNESSNIPKSHGTNSPTHDLYLTYNVLFQLSHIFEYMQENKLNEMDYQEFIVKHSRLGNDSTRGGSVTTSTTDAEREGEVYPVEQVGRKTPKTEQDLTQSSSIETQHKKTIVKNTLDGWLGRYFKIQLQSKTSQAINNAESSDKNKASAWLDYFHAKLEELPELDKSIITKKYLKLEYNGRFPLDDTVINELFISQRQYYYRKKEALYLLGLALGDSWETGT